MKKILKNSLSFLFIIIIILSVIYIVLNIYNKKNIKELEVYSENIIQKSYEDDNRLPVGLYYNNGATRNRIKEIDRPWIQYKDIIVLGTFFTDDDSMLSSLFQYNWNEYYNRFEDIQNCKIGYELSFEAEEGKVIRKTLIRPNDMWDVYDYIQVYMYDDVHQRPYSWYSHVTDEGYSNNTILTSIKLTGGTYTSKITSAIKLTAFTYNGKDDFDVNGFYRGNSSYTVLIHKK